MLLPQLRSFRCAVFATMRRWLAVIDIWRPRIHGNHHHQQRRRQAQTEALSSIAESIDRQTRAVEDLAAAVCALADMHRRNHGDSHRSSESAASAPPCHAFTSGPCRGAKSHAGSSAQGDGAHEYTAAGEAVPELTGANDHWEAPSRGGPQDGVTACLLVDKSAKWGPGTGAHGRQARESPSCASED